MPVPLPFPMSHAMPSNSAAASLAIPGGESLLLHAKLRNISLSSLALAGERGRM